MSDVTQIRTAIAGALAGIGGDVQVSATILPQPTPPTLQVFPGPIAHDSGAFAQKVNQRRYIVQGFVPLNEQVSTQALMDGLLAPTGSRSVKSALEADTTLGGVVSKLWVRSDTGYTMQLHPTGSWFLTCEWTLEVWSQN